MIDSIQVTWKDKGRKLVYQPPSNKTSPPSKIPLLRHVRRTGWINKTKTTTKKIPKGCHNNSNKSITKHNPDGMT